VGKGGQDARTWARHAFRRAYRCGDTRPVGTADLMRCIIRLFGAAFAHPTHFIRTLRAGLGVQAKARRRTAPKTIPNAFGFRAGIDLDKLNQLADELEAEANAAGQSSGASTGSAT
jgi:hypothetical protein